MCGALLLAASTMSFTAAAEENDPEYVFKIVSEQAPEAPESDAHFLQMALDAYIEAGHPNFSYEFEVCAQNDLASRLAILIASNDVPDLFNYEDGTALDAIVDLDAVVNINQDFDELGIELTDVLPENVIEAKHMLSNYDDIYSMPSQLTTNGIFYNKAIFEEQGLEVPETWDEFEASKMTEKDPFLATLSTNYRAALEKWCKDNEVDNTEGLFFVKFKGGCLAEPMDAGFVGSWLKKNVFETNKGLTKVTTNTLCGKNTPRDVFAEVDAGGDFEILGEITFPVIGLTGKSSFDYEAYEADRKACEELFKALKNPKEETDNG